ncbi:MAG: T9SS type A sorting domain-containing protein [Ignavibacteria bacterium]|nr:T9SS type A sorting domain-containing protein [Ignavibacteria bacterium]
MGRRFRFSIYFILSKVLILSNIKIGLKKIVSTQSLSTSKIYSNVGIFNDKIISVWNDERNGPFDVYCNIRSFSNPDTTVNVIQTSSITPENFELYQNYPNPFNPTTNLEFGIPELEFVSLKIFDVLGNEVSTLVNESKPAGRYEVTFNGAGLPSGIYYYKLTSGNYSYTRKMMLIK